MHKRLVVRYEGNPILTGEDFPSGSGIVRVFNSGVVRWGKRYMMVCRAEDAALRNFLWVAESRDGYHFAPRPQPIGLPTDNTVFSEYTASMIYDPRITELDGAFYIVHAAHSGHGCRLSLLKTSDFETFQWLGFISETDNRNGVLFPEKVAGRYARFDRPNVPGGAADIWLSYSPDLLHWGDARCVLRKQQVRWAWTKIGPGAVPIRTRHGWLNIFHGVRTQCASHYVYQLGVCLHDLEDPAQVIGLSEQPVLWPEIQYELLGQTPSVVFTSGAVCEPDGQVKIYYGAADTVQCVALAQLDELVAACLKGGLK